MQRFSLTFLLYICPHGFCLKVDCGKCGIIEHRATAEVLQAMPGGSLPCLLPLPGAAWGGGLQRGGGAGLLHGAVEALAALGRGA